MKLYASFAFETFSIGFIGWSICEVEILSYSITFFPFFDEGREMNEKNK